MSAAAEAIHALSDAPNGTCDLTDLVEAVLAVAARVTDFTLEMVDAQPGVPSIRVFRAGGPDGACVASTSTSARLFRPLMARLAAMSSRENGTTCDPYGDRARFERPSPSGPICLDIAFCNTPDSQRLQVSCHPIGRPHESAAAGRGAIRPAAPVSG